MSRTFSIFLALSVATAQKLTASFDGALGIMGAITFDYSDTSNLNFVNVSVDLDLSNFDPTPVITETCTEFTEFKWHVHSKWTGDASNGFGDACSAEATGGHWDPTKMCGPKSQYQGTLECDNAPEYVCSPEDPALCERGDTSGKFGTLINDPVLKRMQKQAEDPKFSEIIEKPDENWSIVLHAGGNCAGARVLCAKLDMQKADDTGKPSVCSN